MTLESSVLALRLKLAAPVGQGVLARREQRVKREHGAALPGTPDPSMV
jgi:hypothetical protein